MRTPVVFVHGLWLLPSSWDRWAAVFEEAGEVADIALRFVQRFATAEGAGSRTGAGTGETPAG